MLFWILLFALIVSMSFVYKDRIYLVWFFIWLITAFRYKVGTDYMGYVNLFQSFKAGQLNPHYSMDIGFNAILNFIDMVGGGQQMLFFIYATLTFIFFYKGFQYYANNNTTLNILFVILFLVFLFFSTVHIIRFMLAGSIWFYGTKFIVEKRFIKYFITVILATLFHPTAIILLFTYVVRYFSPSPKLIFIFIATSTASIVLSPFQYIIKIVAQYNNLPYLFYLTSEKYNVSASLFAIVNTYIYMLIAILSYKYFKKDKKSQVVFMMFLLFVFMRVLSFDVYIFARLSLYFKPFLIVFLSYFLLRVKFTDKTAKWSLFLLIITFTAYGSILGIAAREYTQKIFYTQYAIDIGLFGEPYIVDIYGSSNLLPNTNINK